MILSAFYDVLITALVLLFVLASGLFLTSFLFPNRRFIWQVSVGGAVAIMLMGWIALILSYLPVGITYSTLVTAISFVVATEVVLLWGKGRLPAFHKVFSMMESYRKNGKEEFLLAIPFVIFVAALIAGLPVAQANNEKGYTEFYIADGYRDNPPWRQTYYSSDSIALTIVVESNERKSESYEIVVATDEEIIQEIDLGILKPGEFSNQLIEIQQQADSEQRYVLFLSKGESTVPYRTLFFWIKTAQS